MDYFLTASIYSILGILFGLLPGYFSSLETVARAILLEHKEVDWRLYAFANINTDSLKRDSRDYLPRNYRIGWRISILWVIGCLALTPFAVIADGGGVTAKIIIICIVFPFFVLLVWLLPVYLLKRYLRKLKPSYRTKDK